jgi:choline dehydrogenase
VGSGWRRDIADSIIVGAGSAGCVLENRLSADATTRVMPLEAGGRDRNPLLRGGTANWGFMTEPEANPGGRVLSWPRGKVLGGSSAITAARTMMVAERGADARLA